MKHGIIDIGSNSVRLSIFADGTVIFRDKITPRLAQGLTAEGGLDKESFNRTVKAVVTLVDRALEYGVDREGVLLFATAAVRQAKNGADFCAEIWEITGLSVDVLTEDEEAEVAFLGAIDGPEGAVLDLGGASCELVVKDGGRMVFCHSLDQGAVKLTDRFHDDTDGLDAYLDQKLKEFSAARVDSLVAVGGTPTSIAYVLSGENVFDPKINHGKPIEKMALADLLSKLKAVAPEKRGDYLGVDARRGETLLCGGYFLYKIMDFLHLEQITVSEKDNLDGYYLLKTRF